jgi:predicted lysophospholipase L1 biosynthesis ABC-type transport system permease subunit
MLKWYAREVHTGQRLDAIVGSHALAIAASAAIGFLASATVAVLSYQLFEKRFLSLKRFFETREGASPGGVQREPAHSNHPVADAASSTEG